MLLTVSKVLLFLFVASAIVFAIGCCVLNGSKKMYDKYTSLDLLYLSFVMSMLAVVTKILIDILGGAL